MGSALDAARRITPVAAARSDAADDGRITMADEAVRVWPMHITQCQLELGQQENIEHVSCILFFSIVDGNVSSAKQSDVNHNVDPALLRVRKAVEETCKAALS